MLRHQPQVTDLYSLIARVPDYPIAAEEMVDLAIEEGADQSVIEFYESFPPEEFFEDSQDLIARSEQIALLERSAREQPFELWGSSEED